MLMSLLICVTFYYR